MTDLKLLCRRVVAAGTLGLAAAHLFAQTGDYIVAVVNQELVTASEVQQRLARVRDEAARNKRDRCRRCRRCASRWSRRLIDERVLVTNARETGARVDDPEIDRAVANVATQNQMTLPQLRERLRQEGIPFAKFRDNIRDQIMVERVREREVVSRIKVSDAEIDELIEKRRAAAGTSAQINIAQILVTVPEGAADGVVAERRGRAEAALKRVRGGEDFAAVAREVSEDSNRTQGGEIGLRPVDRLPDLFARAVQGLKPGEVAPELIRSGAGFHVLKLVDRKESAAFTVDQSRARHILLRPSPELSAEAAARRLLQFKRDILAARAHLRAAGARELRGRQRGARRRSRLDRARLVRSRVRGGDGGAAGRRHLRSGDDALRRAPDPGRRPSPDDARHPPAARAGQEHPARAEVRGGVRRMAARPARPRLHRVPRTAAVTTARARASPRVSGP